MIRKMQRIYKVLLLSLLMAVLLFPTQAFAAYACEAYIPFEVKMSGTDIPQGSKYEIKLESLEEGNPMPVQTDVIIEDAGKDELGPIQYTRPGDYKYKVYQSVEKKDYFIYDTTEYVVIVHVVNDGKGNLVPMVVSYKNNNPEDKSDIDFINKYDKPQEPVPPIEPEPTPEPKPQPPKPQPQPPAPEEPDQGILGEVIPLPLPQLPDEGILGVVRTGDMSMPFLWGGLMIAALLVMIATLGRRKSRD